MYKFQEKAISRIEATLIENGINSPEWKELVRPEIHTLGYKEGDKDYVANVTSSNNKVEVWVYIDELGINIGDKSVTFEYQDYQGDTEKHILEFCAFMSIVLTKGKSAFDVE